MAKAKKKAVSKKYEKSKKVKGRSASGKDKVSKVKKLIRLSKSKKTKKKR